MRWVVGALMVLATSPAAASAATVQADGRAMFYDAAAGESNELGMAFERNGAIVSDPAVDVQAGSGCVQLDQHSARCALVSDSSPYADPEVHVNLGDEDDSLVVSGDGYFAVAVDGGPGSDRLTGGADADTFIEGDSPERDVIDGGSAYGEDTVSYAGRTASVRADLRTATGEDRLLNVQDVIGGEGDDKLIGNAGNNVLLGGAGDDALIGHGGADALLGGRGDDLLTGSGIGNNVTRGALFGGPGADRIRAQGPGGVLVRGGSGDDDVLVRHGFSNVRGGSGDDQLHGGPDYDRLYGGAGEDRISGGPATDYLSGDAGDDIVSGGSGQDTVGGREGNDVLVGGRGFDRIKTRALPRYGMPYASRGNDQFDCGPGPDLVFDPLPTSAVGDGCEALQFGATRYRPELRVQAAPTLTTRHGVFLRVLRGTAPRIEIRQAFGDHLLLGTGDRTDEFGVLRVRLTSTGRQFIGRPQGVLATITISPGLGWRFRLTTAARHGRRGTARSRMPAPRAPRQ